ncbi:MbcA/ParS/Xre antitoxin family protein [Salinisphaera hydrothermalis]|uniref:MbcA/ParS/Xre antitoxin family protein n=1 Tax=Salinisphaera hydrothermalis TaxID=563188 RepID=UPI003342440D
MMIDVKQERSRYERIIGFLGGPAIVDVPAIDSPKALVRLLRCGLPVDSAVFAREHLGLTPVVFDRVLPRTTIASAQKSVSRTLSTAVSENLFRLSRLTVIAEEAFGDPERAHRWLTDPNVVFDNEAPAELADTEAGAKWVESVLMRTMYGIDA